MMNAPSANLNLLRYEYAIDVIRRVSSSLPSRLVFDVGAGDGRMRGPIEAAGYSWTGFDIAPSVPGVVSWDLSRPCSVADNRAGTVLLLDVIEHTTNPGLALENVFEVLEPGGALILTMPNPRWSRSRIHALIHGTPSCFTQHDLDLNGHVFTPWPHILSKMLYDAGYEVAEYVTLDGKASWPGPPLTLRYPLRLLHAAANLVIEHYDSSACGMSYGLVARRKK